MCPLWKLSLQENQFRICSHIVRAVRCFVILFLLRFRVHNASVLVLNIGSPCFTERREYGLSKWQLSAATNNQANHWFQDCRGVLVQWRSQTTDQRVGGIILICNEKEKWRRLSQSKYLDTKDLPISVHFSCHQHGNIYIYIYTHAHISTWQPLWISRLR
jgi:hypothetical protein